MTQDSPAVPALGPGRTALIADGNTDAAESLALVLRLHGYAVEVAFNGPDALSIAATIHPDAAILTLALPGLDGYEVARRLRTANGKNPPLVLIALTGYGRDEDRARTRDAGFDYHLLKPADPLELLELIRATRSTPT